MGKFLRFVFSVFFAGVVVSVNAQTTEVTPPKITTGEVPTPATRPVVRFQRMVVHGPTKVEFLPRQDVLGRANVRGTGVEIRQTYSEKK